MSELNPDDIHQLVSQFLKGEGPQSDVDLLQAEIAAEPTVSLEILIQLQDALERSIPLGLSPAQAAIVETRVQAQIEPMVKHEGLAGFLRKVLPKKNQPSVPLIASQVEPDQTKPEAPVAETVAEAVTAMVEAPPPAVPVVAMPPEVPVEAPRPVAVPLVKEEAPAPVVSPPEVPAEVPAIVETAAPAETPEYELHEEQPPRGVPGAAAQPVASETADPAFWEAFRGVQKARPKIRIQRLVLAAVLGLVVGVTWALLSRPSKPLASTAPLVVPKPAAQPLVPVQALPGVERGSAVEAQPALGLPSELPPLTPVPAGTYPQPALTHP